MKGPVLFDVDDQPAEVTPATAPPVPDLDPVPQAAALQQAAAMAHARPSRLARWFLSILASIILFFSGIAAWDFAAALLVRSPVLGWVAIALLGALVLVLLAIAVKELAAFGRLRRVDRIQTRAADALADQSLERARDVAGQLMAFYRGRDDTRWGRDAFNERQNELLDADALLSHAETSILAPLDDRAQREVEAAARQVATVTALVPLAFADVVAALTANMRMIRRIAEIYGGRSGTLGSWRLTRQVLSHLVATGAVAVGDDIISHVAGGGIMSKLSRRFGEGVINGALTARVGVAAMDVCRPLPFLAEPRPSVTMLVKRSLTGLFARSKTQE